MAILERETRFGSSVMSLRAMSPQSVPGQPTAWCSMRQAMSIIMRLSCCVRKRSVAGRPLSARTVATIDFKRPLPEPGGRRLRRREIGRQT